MKKILLALAITISLGGCAGLQQVQEVVTGATATVQNPVTKDMLYAVENGAAVAAAGLVAYRRTCLAGTIPPSCRDIILKIQPYTKKVKAILPSLRSFVKNNDQVNAVIAYNAIRQLLADFRTVAITNNVPVPITQ